MPSVFLLCPTQTNRRAFHTKSTSEAPTNADSTFGLFLTRVSRARPARPHVNAIGSASNFLFSIVLVNVFIRTGKTVQATEVRTVIKRLTKLKIQDFFKAHWREL